MCTLVARVFIFFLLFFLLFSFNSRRYRRELKVGPPFRSQHCRREFSKFISCWNFVNKSCVYVSCFYQQLFVRQFFRSCGVNAYTCAVLVLCCTFFLFYNSKKNILSISKIKYFKYNKPKNWPNVLMIPLRIIDKLGTNSLRNSVKTGTLTPKINSQTQSTMILPKLYQ